jgi:hypothetical protein
MRDRIGVGAAVPALGVVIAVMTAAGCGQNAVTFQPADGPAGSEGPSVTATATAPAQEAPSGTAQGGVTTDAATGVVITRQGSTVCVRGPRGGRACTSGRGVVVVDGVTVKDGVVVRGDGAAASVVKTRPTTGRVSLSGAVTWSGTARGVCEGHGRGVRRIAAELPGLGRLVVNSVGEGVLRVALVANGTRFGLSSVGRNGTLDVTGSRTVIDDARLGGSGRQVVLSADFDC